MRPDWWLETSRCQLKCNQQGLYCCIEDLIDLKAQRLREAFALCQTCCPLIFILPLRWQGGAWMPLLETCDNATPAAVQSVFSDIALYILPRPGRFLDARSPGMVLRDVGTEANGTTLPVSSFVFSHPYVSFTGPAVSGKFYGLSLDHTPTIKLGQCHEVRQPAGQRWQLLAINGTRQRLDLYQPSTEHLPNDPMVMVANSSNVHVHAWKYESQGPDHYPTCNTSGSMAWITAGSSNVSVFGGSGNYGLWRDKAIVLVNGGAANVTISNQARHVPVGEVTNPLWVYDDGDDHSLNLTAAHDVLLFLDP
eukprot:m.98740 g.98740  ORF g.98740 m.98740 type:complete len:308 (-) comp15292_c0_seq3:132-1055(-)